MRPQKYYLASVRISACHGSTRLTKIFQLGFSEKLMAFHSKDHKSRSGSGFCGFFCQNEFGKLADYFSLKACFTLVTKSSFSHVKSSTFIVLVLPSALLKVLVTVSDLRPM